MPLFPPPGELSSLFSPETNPLLLQAGPLLDVKLPIDRETGEQRPFAFIAYKHPISGETYITLINLEITSIPGDQLTFDIVSRLLLCYVRVQHPF